MRLKTHKVCRETHLQRKARQFCEADGSSPPKVASCDFGKKNFSAVDFARSQRYTFYDHPNRCSLSVRNQLGTSVKLCYTVCEQGEEVARIAYVRVSSEDKSPDRQDDALRQFNLDRTFSDKGSAKTTDRPGLKALLDFVREDDTLYIERISRLARSTSDLLSIVKLLDTRKVALVSLKEAIDTSSSQGRFVIALFGALAELERDTIHQRQREGIAAARARGKPLGRPKAQFPVRWEDVYGRWQSGQITAAGVMKLLGLKRTTFYGLVRRWEAQQGQRVAS